MNRVQVASFSIFALTMESYTLHTSQSVLDDLKFRLAQTRWPDEIPDSSWSYGANLKYMRDLITYWEKEFDWRTVEAQVNQYPNFIATIDGYQIHFVHVRGKGKRSLPLIITHGWPGSFLEMMKLIPLLTENEDFSFDLVIPSMLGFGFSQKVITPGCDVRLMAQLWKKLMNELGYQRFGAQGGDFGAGVSTAMALSFPESVIGLHLNYCPGSYKPILEEGESFTTEEVTYFNDTDNWYTREGGYDIQQKTKPITTAYGLNDSPVGLCAWIVEKFQGWADCKGDIESVITRDELLATVTLYWITQTIHSSMRLYGENTKRPFHLSKKDFINVPVGVSRFPLEEPFPPRVHMERRFNIVHWNDMPVGGHFAALEQPNLLAADITEFFERLTE